MMKLLQNVRGIFAILYLTANTLVWGFFLFSITLLRIVIPIQAWRRFCGRVANLIAENWIQINNIGLLLNGNIKIEVSGVEKLDKKSWYLVVSNHQSWVDIPVLQKVFHGKIPLLKFFLKKELIWVPILGPAWWALDFPFMKRYSKEFLKKKPHLKGKDMEITKKACEKFKDIPVAIMNFTEGTRFTKEKHARQNSPYNHLLKPKAGGIGFVMTAMGEQLSYILDVTISYPEGTPNFWEFLCGKVKKINVGVNKLPVSKELIGDYMNDKEYRITFQKWLNELWNEKDHFFEHVIHGGLKN